MCRPEGVEREDHSLEHGEGAKNYNSNLCPQRFGGLWAGSRKAASVI